MKDEENFPDDCTGGPRASGKIVKVHFGRYDITVKLGPGGEFIGITEVAVNKDFLSHEQKAEYYGYHDVSDLYEE